MKYIRRKFGRVTFISSHLVLDQLAIELIEGLSQKYKPAHRRVLVYVGLHRGFGWRILEPGFKVGLQTEHFYCENGNELWALPKAKAQRRLMRCLRNFDLILDTNPNNARFYEELKLPKKIMDKIHFGPHVFPSEKISYSQTGTGDPLFFGFVTERRQALLAQLAMPLERLEGSYFGKSLYEKISRSKAVANIHVGDGVYTEVPRLLTAYRCGKPVISEELSPPFLAGRHYVDIHNWRQANLEEVYTEFSEFVTSNLSFEAFLRRHQV